jgi:succinyl-diaminopimelate desuccinylase
VRRAVEFATTVGFGQLPAYLRSGGSIPAVGVLRRTFGMAPTLFGLGTPGGGAHGPDEHMDIRGWSRGVDACVALLAAFGRIE